MWPFRRTVLGITLPPKRDTAEKPGHGVPAADLPGKTGRGEGKPRRMLDLRIPPAPLAQKRPGQAPTAGLRATLRKPAEFSLQ